MQQEQARSRALRPHEQLTMLNMRCLYRIDRGVRGVQKSFSLGNYPNIFKYLQSLTLDIDELSRRAELTFSTSNYNIFFNSIQFLKRNYQNLY